MSRVDEMIANIQAMQRDLGGGAETSSDEKLNEELRGILEELKTASRRLKRESEMKRRRSRGFARYLVAIGIGVAGVLAWQSYGEAAKQIAATRAPELGWSPETKQMIASWIQQLGWTRPLTGPENTAVQPSAQQASQAAAVAQPTAPSLDLQQVQQIEADISAVRQAVDQHLADVRQTVEQLAAGQDQMVREITKLQGANREILEKIPPRPPQSLAATARKPMPVRPPSSPAPIPLH